jgi:hypothetical protein
LTTISSAATPPTPLASSSARPASVESAPSTPPTGESASTMDRQPPTANTPVEPTSSETSSPSTQSPIALITLPTVAFQIEYEDSAPRRKAEAACKIQTKEDTQAMAACLQKARDQFLPDVLRFKKGSQGRWLVVIYKRSGTDLRELYTGSVELTDEPSSTVRLKVTGREQGQKPLFKGRTSALITVPNEYSLELEDPQLGKLIYGAKIGLFNE